MNPGENVDLARFLSGAPRGPSEESSIRGACGRAYYAAFAIARDALLAARFNVPKTGAAHARVIDLLKKSKDPQVASAGSLLLQLHTTRKKADYHVGRLAGSRFTRFQGQTAVAVAHTIVAEVHRAIKADPAMGIPAGS